MTTATLIEIFGYIGSALVVVSMLMASIVKLRVVNMVGSVVSGIYALIVGAVPLCLMNGCLIIINLVSLYKLLKTRKSYDLVDGEADDALVEYFLRRYESDIKAYFPEFKREDACGKRAFIVCCDGNLAAVLIGEEEEGAVDILVDYSTPAYRDCSAGHFLYSKLPERSINKLICGLNISPEHSSYLRKMGFAKEESVYVKKLNMVRQK
ncbi:MAG: YgjV family protein [Eubacteriaceae bacterium]|nr:YgjV family protein [Eubacteriaceae bacterium]